MPPSPSRIVVETLVALETATPAVLEEEEEEQLDLPAWDCLGQIQNLWTVGVGIADPRITNEQGVLNTLT